jgi:glucuronate isomerase
MTKSANFIHDDFLLESDPARQLYHAYAANLPIIDYHCHLIPQEIADDRRWDNLTQIWLYGDHYKWRAMRTAGVSEYYCTGEASDWEKFEQFARIMPKLLRNPLYHWSHLELARYFGITDRLLGPETARSIYEDANAIIRGPDFSCRSLMKRSRVETVCTTDDPTDPLSAHRAIAEDASFEVQVLPTWRPDRVLAVDDSSTFLPWVKRLEAAANQEISGLDDLLLVLRRRHEFFAELGCRLSDRGIETVYSEECTHSEAATVFADALAERTVTREGVTRYRSFLLHELALMDADRGWTMQIHYGALRSANSRMLAKIGRDCGFDSIGDWPVAAAMARHFDRLDLLGKLPKTIIYNLNPRDNELIASMLGNFQDGVTAGKMQLGSGWWFLDQIDGMTRQIEALSQLGLLSQFVGMLTDSRSFLSYTRHEYFRRLLCNILGNDIRRGLLPNDIGLVGAMVRDICYENAQRYFGFTCPHRTRGS